MSLPIRVLFFSVVVPAVLVVLVGSLFHLTHDGNTGSTWPQAQVVQQDVVPLPSVDATDAALYVERVNGRADVTCTPAGTDGGTALFTCRGDDGESWNVRGTSSANLNAVVTAPSVFLQSARVDASVAVSAIDNCRKMTGDLPVSGESQTVQATLVCGGGPLTIYLRPGDALEYDRTGAHTYRVTVVAGNGETVTYNSKTRRYKP